MENNQDTQHKEWPEEEPSVSFTIYDSESASDDALEADPQSPKKEKWTGKAIFFSLLLLLLSALIVIAFSFCIRQYEVRMPDYDKIVQRQELQEKKRLQKAEERKMEEQKIEEELRRKQQEELEQKALLEEELSASEDIDEEFTDDEEVEELLRDLFE